MNLQKKQEQVEHNGNKSSLIVAVLLLAVIVVTAFIVYLKSQNIDLGNFSVKDFFTQGLSSSSSKGNEPALSEFKCDGSEEAVFTALKGYVIRCDRNSISGLNRNGGVEWQVSVSMSNPIVKTAGPYLLVGDKGGRDIYVIKNKTVKWDKKLDSNIINLSINEDGYVAVVVEKERYEGIVCVYDSDGDKIFDHGEPDIYLLDAKVSPSDKHVLLSEVDASGTSTNSCLKIINFTGTIEAIFKGTDEIIASTWFMKNDSVLAVSDKEAKYFDKELESQWQQAQNGNILTSNAAAGKYAVLAYSNITQNGLFRGNTTTIKIIGTDGELNGEYEAKGKVKNIDVIGSDIALNTENTVYFINTNGKLIGKYTDKADILEVHFIDSGEALLVTANSIKVVKVG